MAVKIQHVEMQSASFWTELGNLKRTYFLNVPLFILFALILNIVLQFGIHY